MDSLKLWARNGAAVRQAIELGEIAHIETAREELPMSCCCLRSTVVFGSAGLAPCPIHAVPQRFRWR
jgi:hypothetical protein